MKKLFVLIAMAIGMMSVYAQGDADAIAQAFKSGNAAEVARYFDDFVDIKLLEKPEVKNIGRNQAGITLKAFFDENGIKGFDKASEREIGNTMYMTGKLQGANKNYGVTILLKSKDNARRIISIRIN